MIPLPLVGLLALVSVANGYVSHRYAHAHGHAHTYTDNHSSASSPLLKRDGDDPSDMNWIKRWAAIGDSYTAGIGAGRPLGHRIGIDEVDILSPNGEKEVRDNWRCARYNKAYPKVIEAQFGAHVESNGGFQYLACSGDRSEQIYQQAKALEGKLDFVTFTSGGNDLCLAGIIKDCIMLPYGKDSECATVIAKAQENVKSIIKDNILQILEALDEKMNKDGIVVVNGYAQFFDTQTENCEKQSWDFGWFLPGTHDTYQPLTIARRHTFNQLVLDINQAIIDAVDEAAESEKIKYTVGYADWDAWVSTVVDARMCSPSSNGDYPDKNQPDMHFIKPDTHPWPDWFLVSGRENTELRKRDMDPNEELSSARLTSSEKREVNRLKAAMEARDRNLKRTLYDSVLYKSPDPRAAVRHQLDRRAPSPPGCPGDGGADMTFGLGMPDSIGRNFHPNEAGHLTIASFAIGELMDLRAKVLGIDSTACEMPLKDEFTCFSATGSKYYVSGNDTYGYFNSLCFDVTQKPDQTEWTWTSNQGTPEEVEFVLQRGKGDWEFDYEFCIDTFRRIYDSCDNSKADNPMNWKGGGRWIRDGHTYEVHPRRQNRPWPPPKSPYGRCEGWYKVFWETYEVEGTGFVTWDYGRLALGEKTKTMREAMDDCYGVGGTTNWKFDYHENPFEHDGFEWKATFRTPLGTRHRCWENNKVVKAVNGWTNGCGGNA